MKKIFLLLVALISFTFGVNAQNEVWYETDTYKKTELLGDTKGTSIKVEVTCSAKTLAELTQKAEKLALYEYIFIGFPGASPITKLAESADYNESFMSFINNKNEGLQFATGQQNKTKPASEVPDPNGKKKDVLLKATITVDLNIEQIRKMLEAKGMVKSMASISQNMGVITVVVKPNDAWLKRLGSYTEEDNQGRIQIKRDYSKLSLNSDYNDIVQAIRTNLGEGFKIDDISAQLNAANDESLSDKMSDSELQESSDDITARTLQADIYLEVTYETQKISGGQQTQFSLAFTGVDPYTSSSSDMPGQTIRKEATGDNLKSMLDATLKTACDDFKSKALAFLVKRDEKGLGGKVIFKMDAGVALNFSSKIKVGEDRLTFSELIDEAVEELATTGTAFGIQTTTRREYNVSIPSKTKNRKGTEVANSYEKFASKVEGYINDNLKDIEAIVKPVGLGKVTVVFRPVSTEGEK
jgi:hypothetical protein